MEGDFYDTSKSIQAMITEYAFEASEAFVRELGSAIPDVFFDRMTRLLYSTDASIYQVMPFGVALPRDADDVVAAIELAGKHGIPILPRGGGSSLAGQAVGRALILDLSRYMDQILEVDPELRTVRTQPGITLGKLNQHLARYGLMYGPDPASGDRATMGGILGNNSTGAHSIVYGMTVDHVLETEVIMADGRRAQFDAMDVDAWDHRARRPGLEGEVYRKVPRILERFTDVIATRYPKTFRHVAGYNLNQLAGATQPNLTKLVVGSEGTLGVITEMKLNLVPVPRMKRLAMVHFSELRAAMQAVPVLLESRPSAIEVLDKMMLDLTRDRIEYRRLLAFVEGDPQAVLLVEYSGNVAHDLGSGIARLRTKLRQIHHNDPVVVVEDPVQQANVWYVRKVGLGILMSIRGDAKPIPFIEDAAVPVEHLADYVTEIYDFAHSVGVERVAMYAHASAGCLHIRPLVNLKTKEGLRHLRSIAEKSVELVTKYGGTTSGEHGEGLVRGEFSEKLFGPELLQAFLELKNAFDPQGLMNPGKVVTSPRMDDERLLRFGSDYSVTQAPKDTILSFADDGGFSRAIEMCNGAGVCRQLEGGVMCPSFQVTRNEVHSTRGRANALRSAMMGMLGHEGMTSKEVYDVLDLCLSCQACKSECPSAVDVAKLKAEFLYHYHKKNGVPLRAKLFANIDTLLRWSQPFAPLVNLLARDSGKGFLSNLGIHKDRSFPLVAAKRFSQRVQEHNSSEILRSTRDSNQVVFFHDTFMEHNAPHIGEAAIRVLEASGWEPIVLKERACCGRPAMSKGFLEKARELARHNVELLAPYAMRGIPIVGCEPSCMTMLVDTYPDLLPGEATEAVASATRMLDTLLVHIAESGELVLDFDDRVRSVLFHGHCQQKAIFGTESTRRMLELIPNCTVEEVEASCCGMAGSFGYEEEHYELSIQLAELSLAPAVRAAAEETIICAVGTSCREQLEHVTGLKSLHPIEILAEAIRSS